MAEEADDRPDATSIKSVSSLLSRFETINTANNATSRPPPAPKPKALSATPRPDLIPTSQHDHVSDEGPFPLDLHTAALQPGSPQRPLTPAGRRRAPSPPKSRTSSVTTNTTARMPPPAPPLALRTKSPKRSPPVVSVSSPTSPPKRSLATNASPSTRRGPPVTARSKAGHIASQANGSSRNGFNQDAAVQESTLRQSARALDFPTAHTPRDRSPFGGDGAAMKTAMLPPPVNRAGKPRGTSQDLTSASTGHVRSASNLSRTDEKVSPFNTPPSSSSSGSASSSVASPPTTTQSYPPPLPLQSKPTPPNITANHQDVALPPKQHQLNNASKKMQGLQSQPRSSQPSPQRSPRITSGPTGQAINDSDVPTLPPRNRQPSLAPNNVTTVSKESSKPSALNLGFSSESALPNRTPQARQDRLSVQQAPKIRNRTPSPGTNTNGRTTINGRTSPQKAPTTNAVPGAHSAKRSEVTWPQSVDLSEYPDSTRANRRPPTYTDVPKNISVGYDTKLFDVCGDLVCAAGVVTRVWSMLTGKLLLSISHGDTVKVTAVCFKPARNIEEDGARLWLGTNWGELMEIDVASKRTVATNTTAHARREITKLHCHGTDVWSLDEEGKLFVWPADDHGTPSLTKGVANGRTPRRATTSLVVGDDLWLTFGSEVRILTPSGTSELSGQQASPQKATLKAPGEITAAAMVIDQPDKIYFGQSRGDISVFSIKERRCLETVSVSLYKISSLVGVGPYLWSGHSTGIMFVYDTRTKPWAVKKDWPAHETHVVGIASERNSLWKLDLLPVVSLGATNLRIWDGLLQNDWVEDDMVEQEPEYCDFDQLNSLVLTWNVGASKPTDLRYDEEDSNFFRELIESSAGADILTFGLQEIVDLEDKKLTAKSFFKSKQKDVYGQEMLSSAYRAWRDHLSRCLDEYTPLDEPYVLLHTASMVGLFSCVFVKASLRGRVKDVEAAQVKTGMGGLHGNKGALVIRILLDDSSLCFINCHLAAGQNDTLARNNDIASILETTPLSPVRIPSNKAEFFTSGGDGSMILDNESCILNGDLNYRLDTSRDAIINAVNQKQYSRLLDHDQLTKSRRKQPGFRLRNFHEGQITFPPTYKYDVGTDTYDSSEKRRAPAWCDRILHRGKIRQLEYRRHEVRVSDHRPVSSLFEINVKTIRQDRRSQCFEKSNKRFEKLKKETSDRSKLQYLHDVFGLSAEEGRELLEG